MAKTKYRYQVRVRLLNQVIQNPSEWVTYSWHVSKDGAEQELEWQKKYGGCDGVHIEARIFEV